jgi:hypothetical protein
MNVAAFLLLSAIPTSAIETLDISSIAIHPSSLNDANAAFARGVALRADAAKAKPEFERAAVIYDALWTKTEPSAGLALDRARAHRLAGHLANAILALRQGLALFPHDRALQTALAEARSAVAYPHGGELEAMCRPTPVLTIGSRMSAWEGVILAGGLWLITCLAFTRYLMIRRAGGLLFAVVAFLGLLAFGGLWWHDHEVRSTNEESLVVVGEDILLRKGNAVSYAPRLEAPLPRGVEAKVLGDRGGWLHVELAGGVAGWLPATVVVR